MTEMRTAREGSLLKASLLMLVLSILLFWLPVVGPLIAGFAGGRVARTVRAALLAAILPAVVVAVLVGLVLTLFSLPVLGSVAGLGVLLWIVVQDVPVLVGAVAGALTTEAERHVHGPPAGRVDT